jgi:hypothetical protein
MCKMMMMCASLIRIHGLYNEIPSNYGNSCWKNIYYPTFYLGNIFISILYNIQVHWPDIKVCIYSNWDLFSLAVTQQSSTPQISEDVWLQHTRLLRETLHSTDNVNNIHKII